MSRVSRPFLSSAADTMRDFLHYHRALGQRFDTEERALKLFDQYLGAHEIPSLAAITPTLVNDFVCSRRRQVAKSHNHLIGVLRRWFNWLVGQERLSVSPLQLTPRPQTATCPPYLFDQLQARRLLAAAERLTNNNRGHQRGSIYSMIFALLYGLGLRVGEVARLSMQDVDWERNVLSIRETKFLKSRLIPIGPKLASRLKVYLEQRQRSVGPLAPADPLFSFGTDKTRSVNPSTISQVFHQIWPQLGLDVPPGVAPPRLHCLRHSFAVGTLLRWYRQGVEPADRLLLLSTFMGHSHPSSTAVYLTITAELREEANLRFQRFALPLVKGVVS